MGYCFHKNRFQGQVILCYVGFVNDTFTDTVLIGMSFPTLKNDLGGRK